LKNILHLPLSIPQVYDLVQRLVGASEISRHLYPYLINTGNQLVLDVGAGTGLYMGLLSSGAKYIWSDVDWHKYKGFKERPGTALGMMSDATMIALADQSVDYALCAALSHHIPDDRLNLLFQELARVVRGKLIFLDAVQAPSMAAKLLWAADQGSFPRAESTIRAALETHFDIVSSERFSVYHHYVLFVGIPKH
jgi:SAM-dependent methyltransferase